MKILTTAAFSVALLGKRLSNTKWLSLFFLAVGVGIVQIQTTTGSSIPSLRSEPVGSAADAAPYHMHAMNPLKGFAAVTAACFTSGLAGVYFEMVLKNSKGDLWVRNVQLSLFSLIPAALPIIYASNRGTPSVPSPTPGGIFAGFGADLFRNFGLWAWATVAIQVFGGLVTALVIKYSDNIMKGFATSLSIILSFLASVVLFHFHITPAFMIGSSTVLVATWMYNQPAPVLPRDVAALELVSAPVSRSDPILGEKVSYGGGASLGVLRKASFGSSSSQSLSSMFGFSSEKSGVAAAIYRSDCESLLSSQVNTPYSSRPSSPPISEPTSTLR